MFDINCEIISFVCFLFFFPSLSLPLSLHTFPREQAAALLHACFPDGHVLFPPVFSVCRCRIPESARPINLLDKENVSLCVLNESPSFFLVWGCGCFYSFHCLYRFKAGKRTSERLVPESYLRNRTLEGLTAHVAIVRVF